MSLVAFQQFHPREQNESLRCIWCGENARSNRAHIISRKLTTHAQNAPILHLRVCQACNSKCSELEQWVLRRSPLSWIRMMLYAGSSTDQSTQFPSYFFSEVLGEWVVSHLDAKTHAYFVPTQLVFPKNQNAVLLTTELEEKHDELVRNLIATSHDGAPLSDIRPSLPQDFSPRILLMKRGKALAIARSEVEVHESIMWARGLNQKPVSKTRTQLNSSGREQYHFQWSEKNWARFCAKTALETLCLFEGGERCLDPAFSLVRDFVINQKLASGRELLFNKRGPFNSQSTPLPVHLDLTVGQGALDSISGIVPHCGIGMHLVALYEVRGWVLASVVFAGLPASILILAGPNEHLKDFYQMIYDDQEASFDFIRLAYDRANPIIPVEIHGECFVDLEKTYGLKTM